jgi:hypothetical protein
MPERREDLSIGLGIREVTELWSEQGERIVGSSVSQRAGEERHIFEWEHGGDRGRAELTTAQESTVLRLTLQGDDPDSAFRQILERLSDVLDAVGGVDKPSYKLDPDALAAPNEATSRDQPL